LNPPETIMAGLSRRSAAKVDVGELETTDGVAFFVFIGSQFNTERFTAPGDCLLILSC
jgi:hypothetical protein